MHTSAGKIITSGVQSGVKDGGMHLSVLHLIRNPTTLPPTSRRGGGSILPPPSLPSLSLSGGMDLSKRGGNCYARAGLMWGEKSNGCQSQNRLRLIPKMPCFGTFCQLHFMSIEFFVGVMELSWGSLGLRNPMRAPQPELLFSHGGQERDILGIFTFHLIVPSEILLLYL